MCKMSIVAKRHYAIYTNRSLKQSTNNCLTLPNKPTIFVSKLVKWPKSTSDSIGQQKKC